MGLMQYLLKGLERIQLWQHEKETLTKNPFNRNQHGFRKEHGVNTALSQICEDLEWTLQENLVALVVQLDIRGAFDSLQYKDMLKALEDRGASKIYTNWNKFFWNNRSFESENRGVKV